MKNTYSKEDVEVYEIELNNKKIEELISKLNELKESKEHIHFEDLKGNQLLAVHKDTEILK